MTSTVIIRLLDLDGMLVAELPVETYRGPAPQAIRFHEAIYVRGNGWDFQQVVAWDFRPTKHVHAPGHA